MTLDYELPYWTLGVHPIGVDEAGRGALAGPVVAAAVVLHPDRIPDGIDDSKKLSPQRRLALRESIQATALAWGVGIVSAEVIDSINILQSTYNAMHLAIDACCAKLAGNSTVHLLIDGNRFSGRGRTFTTIVKGDAKSLSIAAASILAKTARDTIMIDDLHVMFPQYGFNVHKGYGTIKHRDAVLQCGPCTEHRKSFLNNILGSP